MNIINLTPHTVNFFTKDVVTEVKPSGIIARVDSKTVVVGEIDNIPVTETVFSDVVNLPDPHKGTIYITSAIVAKHAKGRDDVFVPSESVRDSYGKIIGCRSLGRM